MANIENNIESGSDYVAMAMAIILVLTMLIGFAIAVVLICQWV